MARARCYWACRARTWALRWRSPVLWQTHLLTVPVLGAIALVGGSLGTLSFPLSGHARVDRPPEPSRERGGDQQPAAAARALPWSRDRGFRARPGGPTWVFAINAVSF